ncbi:MAG: peptidoglycan DD-metalloendopeptidase family protein [bacterium]|nr:peptidoglycan DD-metalloendopeptidase family protein [bacterium]
MMRYWVPIILLLLAPFLVFGQTDESTLRNQIESKESEINQLEKEIEVYKNQLDEQADVSGTLKGEITRVETQIRKLNTDITLTNRRIERAELRIDELLSEIKSREDSIESERKTLRELMRAVHERSEQSLVEVLISKDTISEFFDEKETSDRLQASLGQSLALLKEEKDSLTDEHVSKEIEETELVSFKKDLSGRKSTQQSINNSKNRLLKDSRNEEDRYQQLLKDREEKRILVQNELAGIEERLRTLIDPTTIPEKRSGVFGLPVPGESLIYTQKFGLTEFARSTGSGVYGGKGHNGVDIKASIGTRVLAGDSGVIKDIGNTDTICPGGSYGRFILVEHPNNLTTLYAHLSSILVNRGDSVNRGQIIGYSGNSGFSTGPHLHFTVYASNTYRLHQTKNCGLIPAGGYLNPEDYL